MGDNGYRCRWTIMGGRHPNGASEWKETWWEKSDWTGYKELGAEKSGRNDQGDSWWETWQEVYVVDNWSGIPRIERSAHKQAKSRQENVWNEKWWEKYNGKGWTEKGSHKYGRSNDQSWWEKWGEQYDGQGMVLKWTDKWAEKDDGTKWGDKWEERFTSGVGHRQGETWHVENSGSRWSRTWGEEHFGDGMVHKYGRSTSGEQWDVVVAEPTYYEGKPHYGWDEAVANSSQLLSIEIRDRTEPISRRASTDMTCDNGQPLASRHLEFSFHMEEVVDIFTPKDMLGGEAAVDALSDAASQADKALSRGQFTAKNASGRVVQSGKFIALWEVSPAGKPSCGVASGATGKECSGRGEGRRALVEEPVSCTGGYQDILHKRPRVAVLLRARQHVVHRHAALGLPSLASLLSRLLPSLCHAPQGGTQLLSTSSDEHSSSASSHASQ
ncbi:unnamed protein product [Closterium sp. NIES-65]|nr:unnamed protein product [Closterium sp. NIES-65]